MRGIIQRVLGARITVKEGEVARIGRGILVFLAVERGDGEEDGEYMARKIAGLRIFPSADGSTESDRSVSELDAEICIVPQFTLMGDVRKGNRPSYSEAEKPDIARDRIMRVVEILKRSGHSIVAGSFREHMHVEIVNDGPYTVILDSRKK
ncbi:MAG: D-tyrosyl-tRNA(Tyr) deacylase [Deltaproteobacteria bacterium]|nr:D-tyrosyl-tRNA(Tyr) deacylase [Deltaproteobacteria bacterium]